MSERTKVGTYEAKSKLPGLLKAVEGEGAEVDILRNGTPVARMIPIPGCDRFASALVIEEIRGMARWPATS